MLTLESAYLHLKCALCTKQSEGRDKHIRINTKCSYSHVPVNLLGLPVTTEQTTQDSHATHPAQLLRHTGIGSTLPLTCDRTKVHLGQLTDLHSQVGNLSHILTLTHLY